MPGKAMPTVELHVAQSIEELNDKHIKVKDQILTKANPVQLVRSSQKVYDTAEEKLKAGDEELAYVHYMKFLHIATFAQKAAEAKKCKDWQPLLDKKKLYHCMQAAETLSDNLKIRYEMRNRSPKEMSSAAVQSPPAITPAITPAISVPKVVVAPTLPTFEDKVTCRELYDLIKRFRGKGGLLVLDARPRLHFEESHIDETCSISVPEEIIVQGWTASKLQAQMPPASLPMWGQRGSAEYVVLMDWNSHLSNVIPSSKLHILRSILQKWDINTVYKRTPLILEGGYEDWLNTYPFQVTNPGVQAPVVADPLVDLLIDDIEYPVWNDSLSPKPASAIPNVDRALKPTSTPVHITPSEDVEPQDTTTRPAIDRASKQLALERMQMEKQLKVQEVLEVQTKRLQAEKHMEELRQRKVEEADNEMLKMKEQSYLQEIERLEKLFEEKERENSVLKDMLDKAVESGGGTASKEITQQISSAEAKLSELTLETDALAKQRHKAGQVIPSRATKPSSAPATSKSIPAAAKTEKRPGADEVRFEALKLDNPGGSNLTRSHSSPNIKDLEEAPPQFDRGSKPVSRLSNQEHLSISRHRDFSPVYGNKGRGLTGLKNLGNSCYMNSIVQCISNTAPLMQYFCEGGYRNDVNTNTKTRGQIVEELAAVVRALWAGEYRAIACRDFKRVAGNYHSDFAGFRQQDSHEFLTLLMNWLHDDLNKRRHIKPIPTPAVDPREIPEPIENLLEQSAQEWSNFLHCNESRIQRLFYGQQSSTVCCGKCGFESVTFEPFSSLTLLLPGDVDKCTLGDCLDIYLKSETISEWKCPRCREQRKAFKKFDIWKLPPILIIHFKRFYEDVLWRKQHTMVDFPVSGLDMRRFTPVIEQKHANYDLYAVSNHYGTMDGGHYTSYSRSSASKKWYKFDDADVSEISENNVRSNAAYILFYSSTSMQPTARMLHS